MAMALSLPNQPSPEVQSASAPSIRAANPPRIIACVLCQQRKVRCDHKNPCSNCTKANVQCVSATLVPRRRKRRFPERELLDRLKRYENLLRQHGIDYEPPHKDSSVGGGNSPYANDGSDLENDYPKTKTSTSPSVDPTPPGTDPQSPSRGKSFWTAIDHEFRNPENIDESSEEDFLPSTLENTWDQVYDNNDYIMFSSGTATKNLYSLHPQPVSMFRLWQIYLDNVNPVLKITHAPTLQQKIIEASGNLSTTSPGFEALMFGIYCAAILSITDEECLNIFGEGKDTMNLRYQNYCQQALVNAGFLRTSDTQVLIALFLYLLSIRPKMDPRSVSTMMGIVVRIAHRLGLHIESCNRDWPPFEAEMRRRLWWQIVLFDSRIGEMTQSKTSFLAPTWDCNIPLNVNDADISPLLKDLPAPREGLTDCLFIMVRCEVADFVRHAPFYLSFVSPLLMGLSRERNATQPRSIDDLEEMIENKYLKHCDPQIPLHFFSSCMARAYVGKWRLVEYLSKNGNINTVSQAQEFRDKMSSNAIRMIELDTIAHTRPLTDGFLWLVSFHLPFPAYVYLVRELRRSPASPLTDRAWDVMAINFEQRELGSMWPRWPIFVSFRNSILKAWEARESVLEERGEVPIPPKFVSLIRAMTAREEQPTMPYPSPYDAAIDPSSGLHSTIQRQPNSDMFSASFADSALTSPTGWESDQNQLGIWSMDWTFMGSMMGNSLQTGGQIQNETQGIDLATFGNW